MKKVDGIENSDQEILKMLKLFYGENRIKETEQRAGFTVGEMVIVIAVIAILAALIAPVAVNVITQNRINACIEELEIIKKSIVGDPSFVEGGTRSSFGFVGDMGILPRDNLGTLGFGQNNTLGDLMNQNGLQGSPGPGVLLWGWRGPYINEDLDPWGRRYIYDTNTGNPLIGAVVRSSGQDGIDGTADDISVSIRLDEVSSMVGGNTLDSCGAGTACDIDIYTPDGSSVQVIDFTDTTAENPIYNTGGTRIPIGIRLIEFTVSGNTYMKFLYINNGPLTVVNFRVPGSCPH